MGHIRAKDKWPSEHIAFKVAPEIKPVPLYQSILDAVAHWNKCTPVKLSERNSPQDAYIYFRFFHDDTADGASNWIGFHPIGDRHTIKLEPGSSRATVIHELGHGLGLRHEHTRKDRDAYVKCNRDNVTRGDRINFTRSLTSNGMQGFYDYDSIMHYGMHAFSRNGQPTLVPTLPLNLESNNIPVVIGRDGGLSRGDVMSILTVYDPISAVNLSISNFGGVTIYQHAKYNTDAPGALSYFSFDDIPDLGDRGIQLDKQISSMVLHGRIAGVTLYEEKNYRGGCLTILKEEHRVVENFQTIEFNDRVSSLQILRHTWDPHKR